jgi:LacI family transcriptional regulator
VDQDNVREDEGERPRPRNVTLKDVARLAGVSIATASKAINGRDQVHPETRKRVLDVAKRISFVPNSLAQGLLTGQTRTVGLLTNDLVGRFSIPVLMGAEDAFGTGRISVLLCDARGDSIREAYHLDALIGRRVDGLIVVGSSTDVRPSLGRELPIPVVYAYAPSDDPRDLSLVPDNTGAGALAIKHLLETGRTRIAHITGEEGYLAARDRADGVVAAMKAAGLSLVGDEVRYGNWTESWGRAATRTLLDQHPEVDAVLCGSDQIARGALDAIREANRSVPEDIAVAGFDNWDVVVTGARPQLTSVDMDLENLGRTAAERLFSAMGGSNHSGIESLPCRLVVRGSTVPDS